MWPAETAFFGRDFILCVAVVYQLCGLWRSSRRELRVGRPAGGDHHLVQWVMQHPRRRRRLPPPIFLARRMGKWDLHLAQAWGSNSLNPALLLSLITSEALNFAMKALALGLNCS
jgi:hypothetical protein